jgi:malate synthase
MSRVKDQYWMEISLNSREAIREREAREGMQALYDNFRPRKDDLLEKLEDQLCRQEKWMTQHDLHYPTK